VAAGYLNAYRILISDLVVVTGELDEALRAALLAVKPGARMVGARLRPRPLQPIEGRRVAFFTCAPESAHEQLTAHIRAEHGADVVHVSGSLSHRAALRDELARTDADVYLVELKAAAIDVVAEDAAARGREVVLAVNDVVPLPGEPNLDEELRLLAPAPVAT
jgi:cyclic 2,3-diphosphoglycerate synthetase